METKDWILLIIPIIANGIIVFLFQKYITNKLDHINKRNSIRDEVIILFWKKLQNLNEMFIQANVAVQNNPATLSTELEKIKDGVLSIIQYYDTNKYDLAIYSKEYNEWESTWNKFSSTIIAFSHSTLNTQMQLQLGNELQDVKTKTQELIDVTRKKY